MVKKIFLITLTLICSNHLLVGTNQFILNSAQNGNTKIQFAPGDIQTESIGEYTRFVSPNSGKTTEQGMPELPLFSTFVQIDPIKEYLVSYSVIQSHTLENVKIYPFQNDREGKSPSIINHVNLEYYESGHSYPEENLIVSDRLVMRGLQLFNISIVPFEYNPTSNEMVVYNEIEITVEEIGDRESDEFTPQLRSRTFEKLYETMIVNYSPSGRDEDYQAPAILYICGGNSEDNSYFQQLVDWRHKRGYVVYTASLSETGSSSSQIKNYITNAFNTFSPRPEFVALVGDVGGSYSVPTFYEGWGHNSYGNDCEGDHPYSQLNGDDLLPEVLIGRLSVRSTSDLSVVTSKIVNYEKATYMADMITYYEKAALVGDPSSSGISTVISNEYVEEIMVAHGMEDVRTKFSGGGYSSWMQSQLNEGVLYLNYRGYLGVSGFGSGNVDGANNGFKLPFATILTCGTGSFAEDNTALTEKFLRAGTSSNPKGGVASIGTATWNTHTLFNNIVDMGLYDGLFAKQLGTAGAALANGKLALFSAYPSNPYNWVSAFTQWNNLMGDPATHLWTDTPDILWVTYPSEIPFGTNFIDVSVQNQNGTPAENAMVTLLKSNDEIFMNGFANSVGNITFDLNSSSEGIVAVTVTKQNCKPYEGSFSITMASKLVNVNHEQGIEIHNDDDGVLSSGETVGLSIPLENFGTENVTGISATLSTTSPLVTLSNETVVYGTINVGQSQYGDDFILSVAPSAIHREDLGLRLHITDDSSFPSNEWDAVIHLDVDGSLLIIHGNGYMEPGATSTFSIILQNTGVETAMGVFGELISFGNLIEISDNYGSWGDILPMGSVTSDMFTITAGNDILNGTILSIGLHIQSEEGYDRTEYYQLQIGTVSEIDPFGPDQYGYYIYDSGDTGYDLAPIYDWIEIDPGYGGPGTDLNLSDSGNGNYSTSSAYIDLPFTFKFYGVDYDEITVNSNGWIAFGHSEMESFRNYSIPGAGGPSPMVAAFWDDLKTSSGGDVFGYVDPDDEFVIIEWSDMRTYYANSVETFQIILYNNPAQPYGDGEIKIQYNEFNNTSSGNYSNYTPTHGAYSTIGTENHLGNDGLQYTFDDKYPTAAMELDDETAIFITTQPPTALPSPDLTYNPGTFDFIVALNETASSNLIFSNIGEAGSVLSYAISETYPLPFVNPGGGPDSFSQYWSDSDLDSDLNYEWVDISGLGTQLVFPHNDQAADPINISFEFPFYGETYTQCIVNPNGWIGFGEDNTAFSNTSIPSSSAPQPAIFGFWDDLSPEIEGGSGCSVQGGNVYTYAFNDKLVIWFDHVARCSSNYPGTYDFEVVLHNTGHVDINYREMEGYLTSATIGMQNGDGTDGLQVGYNDDYVTSELSLQFRRIVDWLTIASETNELEGELYDGESAEFMLEVNSAGLSEGSYDASIFIDTNAEPTVTIPVSLTVDATANQVVISVPFSEGWNMMGLPAEVEDASYLSLFPDAIENTLYSFDGSYNQEEELLEGFGYWLRFTTAGSSDIMGLPNDEISILLHEGWNMISGISTPVSVTDIDDPEGIIVSNTFYFYDNGYSNASILEPGQGYWVRALATGNITITNSNRASRNQFASALESANSISFFNSNGKAGELYFGVSIPEEEKLSYSMPPKPPAGGFDIRFAGDFKYCEDSGDIEILNNGDNLIIAYSVTHGNDEEWMLTTDRGEEWMLDQSGEIVMNGDVQHIYLEKSLLSPTEFALNPNYPNPFNPVTTINYSIPKLSDVQVIVYDITGRQIITLVEATQEPGHYTIQWNAHDAASGLYFLKLESNGKTQTRKIMLLK